MPEGPEVRKMVDKLQKYDNAKIKNIQILSGRYKRHGKPKLMNKFLKTLPVKIDSINVKGKFVWIILKNNWSIWITLGMTGKFVSYNTKHSHIRFTTTKGTFYLNDMRNFGTVTFCEDPACLEKKVDCLGPDLIVDKPAKNYLCKKIEKTKSNKIIADYLLDQSVLAGVGNYIRADAMYMAGVYPFKNIHSLTGKECKKLQESIRKILNKNYRLKNRSHKFLIYGKVLTDKGKRVTCTNHLGRAIYWVVTHQK